MRILIADSVWNADGGPGTALLQAHGCEIVANPHGRRLQAGELVDLASGCPGILAGSERYTRDVLEALPGLRCISRVGVGLDNIDLEAARALGIRIRNTPDAPTESVAEFALALMLALLRGIPRMDRQVRDGRWARQIGANLAGRRVGLIGLGRIGKRLAQRLMWLGARVDAFDVAPDRGWARDHGVGLGTLKGALSGSDIVSLHLPYSPETHHLIGRAQLCLMPPGSFLINTSRGGLVDEEALREALLDGHLAGAALDVFQEEPYRGPLRGLDGVILTPHAASATAEARELMEEQAVRNLLAELGQGLTA